ncbi:50S ribosomal protein L7 [uncultured Oscillibacter sp.]|uniref:L7Ae/L30e/S12e/Gadd45 family ribosomal protein n=1 Tax=uncultured Oscillibacter sp. TaxID=876091 RepID=UPI00262A47CD|nr:50S ribosomal protein L7 [uncultured Oscillibacter sp.]
MSGNNVLSLLGLALRGGRLAVGEEPAALAAKAGQARLLLTASDAAGNTLRRAEHLAEEGHCLWLVLPFTKAELGGALGRASAAIAALTDLGLAAAVAERLARLDPERYGEAAARMDLKRRRARERKDAPRRDPPKKAPPPKERDRRAGTPRREEGRPPRDGRRPGRAGAPRPRNGRPGENRAGRPERPEARGPAKGRPPRGGGGGRPPFGRTKGGGR